MKFGMISNCGEGAGILYRLMLEGNNVKLWTKNKTYKNCWQGILPRVNNYSELLGGDYFILFDTVGFGSINELCKRSNIRSFGGSNFADKLEGDRKFGSDYMTKLGIKIPDTKTFTDISDAINYSKKKKRLVFKPHGDHNIVSTNLTYVSSDSEDMIEYLMFIDKHIKDISTFDLQDFIEGVAVSSEVLIFNGKPTKIYDHTIENKKFMNGNIGPSTGCEGNLVWVEESMDRLISDGIGKVKDFQDFTGFIDLNCIINDEGVYGLEWTPRFGYDATPTLLCCLLKSDLGKLFTECDGEFNTNFAASIKFSIPPYPLEGSSPDYDNTGIPINIPNFDDKDYYFYEVMIQHEELVHSSGIGNIGLGFGVSNDLDDAFDLALAKVEDTKIPDKQYRTDLGEVISNDFSKFLEACYV